MEEEDKTIAIFREDGTYRYYDFPPEEYYDGTYSYDEMSGVLTTDDGVNEQTCLTEITVSTMKWIYDEGDAAFNSYFCAGFLSRNGARFGA